MKTEHIRIPVGSFETVGDVISKLNQIVAGKEITAVFYNKASLLKGEVEVFVSNPALKDKIVYRERPSKFKQDASSQYYCVYRKGGGYTYKFVNKKISDSPFLGKIYPNELEAAFAYDEHRYSVEGDLSKLNFPERFMSAGK